MTYRTSRPVADIRWVSLDEADAEEDVGTDHTVIGSARADREEENG